MVPAFLNDRARMTATLADDLRTRAIRLWLYAVAALIFAMVLVGGATRLTESGPLDRRMEAGDRHAAAAERGRMAGRVREISRPSRNTSELNRGMTPRRVQDHLLVGMDAPAARRG